ncbi:nacht nucleoside triphosphatase [Ophiostoma piceae UAMH 11346]|uniref:Nacht nucleoside triphosphatase n=1 Tax=Ophiostoma piceae (strain UAMH 11346) TaxID=1262450 RepID=S3C8E5_OPHP1|nr:nacht nucleoside triphosphatase [Ophiostoma piceae UAMH 11346]
MDPISALGLASNIIQFVDFASQLVTTGLDIYKSSHGATRENAALEVSVTQLKNFTASLKVVHADHGKPSLRQSVSIPTELVYQHKELSAPHIATIQTVASECSLLCAETLSIVNGLKVPHDTSFRRLRAMAATVKTFYRGKEIKDLDERLRNQQARLGLCFFPLLNEQHRYTIEVAQHISAQGKTLSNGQTAGFQAISEQLDALGDRIQNASIPTRQPPHYTRRRSYKQHPMTEPSHNYINDIKHIVNDLSLADDDLALLEKQQSFVRSLHVEGQSERHESIPEAYRATFEWVLPEEVPGDEPFQPAGDAKKAEKAKMKESKQDTKRHSLSRWLKHENGIFWVSGRPGSGKSTLMKFIADHPRTRTALEAWADGKPLAVASHYFWISGTTLQKSLKGMLLRLLFDVLQHQPELAQDVFGARFQNWNTGYSAEVLATRGEDAWTIKELATALESLTENKDLGIRICFFIDGLDEYDGDHFELCRVLKNMKFSGNVKLCVSSRPWNVFEQAFGADQARMIHVHELTWNDIKVFAEHHLQNHGVSDTVYLSKSDIHKLSQYITETAKGVFLWVHLATKSLRDGVVAGDTVGDLWKRLEDFPAELEPFFLRILEGVDKTHQRYMADVFQMMLFTYERMRLTKIYVAYSLAQQHGLVQNESDLRTCLDIPLEQIKRQFNARTGGLTSVSSDGEHVILIHRTVRDFLVSNPTQKYLREKSPSFHPYLGLLKSTFCYLRWALLHDDIPDAHSFGYLRHHIGAVAERAMVEDSDETIKVLDTCTEIVSEPAYRNNAYAHKVLHEFLALDGLALADSDDMEATNTESAVLRKLSLKRFFIFCKRYYSAKVAADKTFFKGYNNSELTYDISRHTTAEENHIQLADAMYYADETQYRANHLETLLDRVAAFEHVLASAIKTTLPLASYGPVLRNTRLMAKLDPQLVASLKSHIESLESAAAAVEGNRPDR